MLIGLDCAEPSLVLERWRDELPTLSGLMERGSYGRLTSVIPPITVPAWSCMMSSKTPGDLGVYGFRNRSDHTYDGGFIAMSDAIREPRLWDLVTRAGGSSVVLSRARHVPAAAAERRHGELLPDPVAGEQVHVPGRAARRDRGGRRRVPLRHEGLPHRRQGLPPAPGVRDDRPAVRARRAPRGDEAVDVLRDGRDGPRPDAPRVLEVHGPGAPQARAGELVRVRDPRLPPPRRRAHRGLLEHADEDTVVFVLSDHGAKRLDGGIRINEWLRREGLLATLAEPDGVSSLRDVGVDWPKTTAWGEGGYYARVFLNVQGREPEGVDSAGRVRGVRDDLARRIAAIPDDAGNPIPPPSTSRRSCTTTRRASHPISSSSSATCSGARSGRSAATRASRRSRTTPAPTTRTTRRTASTSSPGRASTRAAAWTRTCSTSRRPCSRSSGSRSRRACAGESMLSALAAR